jgi:hypothetical protein
LYGFQNKNKRSFKDIGTFYCCYLPIAILKVYSHTADIPEYKIKYSHNTVLKKAIGITPFIVAANMGIGVLIGEMGRKAICGEDA